MPSTKTYPYPTKNDDVVGLPQATPVEQFSASANYPTATTTTTHPPTSSYMHTGSAATAPARMTTSATRTQETYNVNDMNGSAFVGAGQPQPQPQQYCQYNPTAAAAVYQPKYVMVDSRRPVTLTCCPKCSKENVRTRTHTKPNGTTAICVVAGVFIFWPLCWIPLCIRPMKQTNHYCTSCGTKVGRVKPFQ